MKLPTLYKKDKAGRIRIWQIEHEGGAYRTTEGIVGGKMQTTKWTDCQATNTGKANARNPEQQADFEARALWQKKVDAGAAESPNDCGAEWVEPMLAHTYQDRVAKGKIAFPLAVQPKLDGHRCLIYLKDGKPYAQTRKGKTIVAVPHILRAVAPVLEAYPNIVLDGELYNHALKSEFEKISSLVRKQNPTREALTQSQLLIQFHLYDIAGPGIGSEQFSVRTRMIENQIMPRVESDDCIVRVSTRLVSGEQELEAYEERAVGEGYEGIMVRVPDSQYFAGRSHALLKLKRFDDAEFTLVDLQEGVGNRGGLATRAFLRMPNGQGTFAAGVVGDDATTAAMLTNKSKYIGKLWTVKYKGLTSAGIPRHAKLMRQRID